MNMCKKVEKFVCKAQTMTEELACDYCKKGVATGCDSRLVNGMCGNYNAMIGERYLLSSNQFKVVPYIKSKYDLGTFILRGAKEKITELDKEYPDNLHLLERVTGFLIQ